MTPSPHYALAHLDPDVRRAVEAWFTEIVAYPSKVALYYSARTAEDRRRAFKVIDGDRKCP